MDTEPPIATLARVVVVLNEPQDVVNVGAVVRVMKNMGLSRLRLVRPAEFDPYRIEGVAHTGRDVIERAELFDELSGALAGCRRIIGTTARGRRVRREYRRPRDAAAEIARVASGGGDVAVVFGREDRGLSNTDLDLCDRVVVIPTAPEHTSLNLAQACVILAYEIFLAAGAEPPFREPRRAAVAAPAEERDRLVGAIESTLRAVDFFKAHRTTHILRTVREVIGRADLDARETALFRAMAIEVRKYLARHGVPGADARGAEQRGPDARDPERPGPDEIGPDELGPDPARE